MVKKSLLLLLVIIFSLFVLAQGNKIEISGLKDNYPPGENITLKVSLYDSENKPIKADVSVAIEDAGKTKSIEKIISSDTLVDISLGENAKNGYWKIIVKYQGDEATSLFFVETSEIAKFNLRGDLLTITNTGNTKYTKDVQIVFGDTIKTKKMDLDIGESLSFRLIAPDGVYNIKVTDGRTTLSRNEVALTGEAIGILDERLEKESPGITGIVNPKTPSKNRNLLVYIFIIILVASLILLSLERFYKKRAKG